MSEPKTEPAAHNWWERFKEAYRKEEGYVFRLSGNVHDVFPETEKGPFITLRKLLAKRLSETRDIVVFYDKSSGFTFADEILSEGSDQRRKFKALMDIGGDEPTSSSSSQSSSGLMDEIAQQMESGESGNDSSGDLPTDPEEAIPLLEEFLQIGEPQGRKGAAIIEYAESVFSEQDSCSEQIVSLQRWAGMDSPLRASRNPVILIERNRGQLSRTLRSDSSNVVPIEIPRPDRKELQHFILWARTYYDRVEIDRDPEVFANLCTGLRCRDVEDILMESMMGGEPVSDGDVWDEKRERIEGQSEGALQPVQPKHGFDAIGGLDYVIDALETQVENLRNCADHTDKGWLLMGPPGTGKSILAEALAKESGVNFVKLGSIRSKWVGESEENMSLALEIAQAMAPTIIFIDEAAEAIGDGSGHSGDSGVSDRLRGMLQNVMGDDSNRGELFFMLATNYPENLSTAMLRDGRVDKRIPLLPSDREGREDILEALCDKHNINSENINFSVVLEETDGWTGAELEALLLRAKEFSHEDSEADEVTTEHLEDAHWDYIPSRDEDGFQCMTQQALRFTNSRRLMPPRYQEQIDRSREIQEETDDAEPAPQRNEPGRQVATI
ncbi:MAG: ATP-binding protein [Candidatus Magasanikbacteria bacterium]